MRDIFSDVTPKRHKSGKAERPKPADVDDLLAASPFILERAMTGLSRALKGKHFDRASGADAYINKLLDEGTVDEASEPTMPLEEAQDLMYLAWEATDLEERIALAEEALEISADCADAFTLLGNDKAMSAAEARAYYEEGVRAGLRAMGQDSTRRQYWNVLGYSRDASVHARAT